MIAERTHTHSPHVSELYHLLNKRLYCFNYLRALGLLLPIQQVKCILPFGAFGERAHARTKWFLGPEAVTNV